MFLDIEMNKQKKIDGLLKKLSKNKYAKHFLKEVKVTYKIYEND